MGNLEVVEKYTFPVIETILNALKHTNYQFSAGDSLLIRAYTPYKRDLEDLDLIFKPGTDINELQKFISTALPASRQEDAVIIKTAENGTGGFLRMRFPIGITYNRENYFIVDFHVGGSVYKGNFCCIPDNIFFDKLTWMKVTSASGLEELNIPVPSLEEALLFKIAKFIGKDKHDIISLLTTESINLNILRERCKTYPLQLPGNESIEKKLQSLQADFDALVDQWGCYHFTHLQKRKIIIARTNLKNLKGIINESYKSS